MAWVVLLTFLFTSFMPTNLLAGNSVAEAAGKNVQGQIITSNLDENNKPVWREFENNQVKINKSITPYKDKDGNEFENKFKITLNVITEDKIEKYVKSDSADVVLVLDRSSSMKGDKFQKLQNAACTFVDAMLGEDAAEGNRVGLVWFDKSVNVEMFNGQMLVSKDQKEKLKAQIRQKSTGSGTNIQGGLHKASEIINDPKREQFIVVFSDGAPYNSYTGTAITNETNFWNNKTWRITSFNYNELRGNGGKDIDYWIDGKHVTDHYFPTASEAYLLKEKGIEIYSIFLGSSEAPKKLMKHIATDEKHSVSVEDANSLAEKFKEFSKEILEKTNAWKVIDPMSDAVIYDGLGTGQPGRVHCSLT